MVDCFAARVLTDYFDSVTIVERDRFPKTPGPRLVCLSRAHMCCWCKDSGFWNSFSWSELTAAGASTVDWTADCAMLGFSGWEPRFSSGLTTRTCSRNLLEWTVRHRLAAYSNIRFLDDCQVLGLLSNASKTSVTGVRVRHYNYPQQNPSATEEVQAN